MYQPGNNGNHAVLYMHMMQWYMHVCFYVASVEFIVKNTDKRVKCTGTYDAEDRTDRKSVV